MVGMPWHWDSVKVIFIYLVHVAWNSSLSFLFANIHLKFCFSAPLVQMVPITQSICCFNQNEKDVWRGLVLDDAV